MEQSRVHLVIKGRVQGVFYRASTQATAINLGLKGWVRNLPDGSVEAVFEGPTENIGVAVEWCRQGPPGASVSEIDEKCSDYTGEYSHFSVTYGW
ncbi:MAG TPA: acylphosphatase [Nitrospirae bacterium]|nr:acylphosphatase [Nitrospirota bacterium]HDN95324.1 acylphosphatase [Nitrospirota bacterium]